MSHSKSELHKHTPTWIPASSRELDSMASRAPANSMILWFYDSMDPMVLCFFLIFQLSLSMLRAMLADSHGGATLCTATHCCSCHRCIPAVEGQQPSYAILKAALISVAGDGLHHRQARFKGQCLHFHFLALGIPFHVSTLFPIVLCGLGSHSVAAV